jgi:predicted secreted protein
VGSSARGAGPRVEWHGRASMTEEAIPERLRLAPGDERLFPLPAHGSGGYRWHCQAEGDCVRASIDYEEIPPERELESRGRSATQLLTIVAVRAGSAVVLLEERRSWEPQPVDARRVDVDVMSGQ